MRLSVCFLSGASMSKVILSTINCNRNFGVLVVSTMFSLLLLAYFAFVNPSLKLRL